MTAVQLTNADLRTVDSTLRTTRAFRRRLDVTRPVDPADVCAAIDVAIHGPSAENHQNWRWLVVTDASTRAAIADRYLQAWTIHRSGQAGRVRRRRGGSDPANIASVDWLAQHLAEVPMMVVPCTVGRPPAPGSFMPATDVALDHVANVMYYGSILPAIWSFQIALRARGLGSVFTCMHLPFEAEVALLLGIPRAVTQVGLLPVAHLTGTEVGEAQRTPARVMWEVWDGELDHG